MLCMFLYLKFVSTSVKNNVILTIRIVALMRHNKIFFIMTGIYAQFRLLHTIAPLANVSGVIAPTFIGSHNKI